MSHALSSKRNYNRPYAIYDLYCFEVWMVFVSAIRLSPILCGRSRMLRQMFGGDSGEGPACQTPSSLSLGAPDGCGSTSLSPSLGQIGFTSGHHLPSCHH